MITLSNQPKRDAFDELLDDISTKDFPSESNAPAESILPEDMRGLFPCEQCGGSGKFYGRHGHAKDKDHCFACNGRGYFKTSKADRLKSRVKSHERKRKSLINSLEIFEEENPGIRAYLAKASTENTFAASLNSKLNKFGDLTPRQIAAVHGLQERDNMTPDMIAAKADKFDADHIGVRAFLVRASDKNLFASSILKKLNEHGDLTPNQLNAVISMKTKAEAEISVVPTLDRLAKAFLDSSAHLKFPKLRLLTEDGLKVVLSRAGEKARDPGSITMTDGGPFGNNVYYGRITPDGKALYKSAPQSVIALLSAFNADPAAEMLVQGRRTACCCLCGRELTNEESLARGVGPICAENWGL